MAPILSLIILSSIASVYVSANGADTSQTLKTDGAKAFVYNPLLQGSNGTMKSDGGSTQKRMVQQWPALAGQGVSQTVFTLDPCALRPPHAHPRASGLLYVISGARFVVGFVTEDGVPVTNEVSTGASALFPQGLIHFQQNLDCYQATYTISYNSENPGTQMTYNSLEALPTGVVSATMGVNSSSEFTTLVAAYPKGAFIPRSDPDCLARCQLAPAPAPSQVQSQSLSG